jgi:DNA-directed RNA polymerase specialized sigma24 family protein
MFKQPADVVAALRRFRTYYDPKTASLLLVGRGGSDMDADPFRGGFLSTIEERHELLRRLGTLEPRARRLLVLWHVEGTPVASIARKLCMSRVHCYRVQRAALEKMIDPKVEDEEDPREAVAR